MVPQSPTVQSSRPLPFEAGVVPWEAGKRAALKIPSHSLKSQVTSRLRRRYEGAKGSHTASLLRRVAQGHLATEQFEGDRADHQQIEQGNSHSMNCAGRSSSPARSVAGIVPCTC